jgi:hypothetical protein
MFSNVELEIFMNFHVFEIVVNDIFYLIFLEYSVFWNYLHISYID